MCIFPNNKAVSEKYRVSPGANERERICYSKIRMPSFMEAEARSEAPLPGHLPGKEPEFF